MTQMAEAHSVSTPMVTNYKLSKHGADLFHDPTLYRSVVVPRSMLPLLDQKSIFLLTRFVNIWLIPWILTGL